MMVSNKIVQYLVVFLFILGSCGKKKLHEQREIDNMVYELTPYKADHKTGEDFSAFKFTICEKKKGSKISDYFKHSNFNKLLYYINKNINSDFLLTVNNKGISPATVYFEPNTAITNKLVFLVAFKKNDLDENVSFEFNDNLFNKGNIKFNINKDFKL